MSETQTQEAQQAPTLAALFAGLEDEHHHPRSGRLWVVLLVLTLLEVGIASSWSPLPAKTLKPGEIKDSQGLCQAIYSEYQKDQEILKARLKAMKTQSNPLVLKAELSKETLQLTGRPGHRIYNMLSADAKALVKRGASSELSKEDKKALAAALQSSVLENKSFYNDEAFSAIEVPTAMRHKIDGLRKHNPMEGVMAFAGEADTLTLNRGLLDRSYPDSITPSPINKLLIFGLMFFAVAKALFVFFYFMHVKWEGTWLRILTIPSLTLAFVVVVFLAPDVGGVDKADWVWTFLAPLALMIVATFGLVLYLTRQDPDYQKMLDAAAREGEPAHH